MSADEIQDIIALLDKKLINPELPAPLYHQLYKLLHDAIIEGVIPNGAKMPTEKKLAAAFDVSHITARRAMDELALKGMVLRQRGRGSFVDHHFHPDPIHAPLKRLMRSLEHNGSETTTKVLSKDFTAPPEKISSLFKIETDDELFFMIRIRLDEGVAFAHYTSWTRGLDPDLTIEEIENTPRIKLFSDQNIEVVRMDHTISATAASPEVAEALKVEVGKPLMKLEHIFFDSNDNVQDVITGLYNSDRFLYQQESLLD